MRKNTPQLLSPQLQTTEYRPVIQCSGIERLPRVQVEKSGLGFRRNHGARQVYGAHQHARVHLDYLRVRRRPVKERARDVRRAVEVLSAGIHWMKMSTFLTRS